MNLIPSVLTKDGKSELYFFEYGDEGSGDKFSILDENLQVKQQFTIKESLLNQYSLIEDIQIISGELGPMEFDQGVFGAEGIILIKDIFGNGYNFLMAAKNEIKVFDSDCKEIAQMNIPKGYDIPEDFGTKAFLRLGNNLYFVTRLHKDGSDYDDNEYIALYSIGGNDSGVSLVAIAPSAKVSPRVPRKGENVTVTIGSEMSGRDCMLQVISASGQTIFGTKVAAGQTQVIINTSSFSKGVYVVTITDNVESKETAKIIIR